jgi:hypothetical protein
MPLAQREAFGIAFTPYMTVYSRFRSGICSCKCRFDCSTHFRVVCSGDVSDCAWQMLPISPLVGSYKPPARQIRSPVRIAGSLG